MDYNSKGKKKGKTFFQSLKTVGFIIAVLAILLIFFSLAAMIENIGNTVKDSITGDVVYIGGRNESEWVNWSEIDYADENVECWLENGLTEQDILVAGHLLKEIDCPKGERGNLSAVFKDGCIEISINGEGETKLCSERKNPVILIGLIKTKEYPPGTFPEGFDVPDRNYYWYVLFFLIIFVIVLFWRQYEINVKSDIEIRAERERLKKEREKEEKRKKYLAGVKIEHKKKKYKEKGEKEVVHVEPAPFYDEEKARKREERERKLAIKIKKDEEKGEKEVGKKKNKLIAEFNKLSEEVNKLIIGGKLVESRKKYFKLFKIYSDLITLVNKRNRMTLDSAMEYLCNYLGVLEKIKGVKRTGVEQKAREIKEKEETIKPKPQILDMEQLETMKDLLRKKQYQQAKRMFYGGDVGDFDVKEMREVAVKKGKDKMDEIELRHDKLLQKGVVNVNEDDFYKFMYDLSLLRKELKKRGKTKINKKKG